MANIVEIFSDDINKLAEKFIQKIMQIIAGAEFPRAEMERIVAQANFFLSEPTISERIEKFMNEYDDIVYKIVKDAQAKGIGGLNNFGLEQIEVLRQLDYDLLLKRGSMFEAELRSELFKSITEGISSDEITKRILPRIQETVTYSPAWFGSMLNTAYQNYNSASTEILFQGVEEAKFILTGPVDSRTRPACMAAMKYQNPKGYTVEEINEGAYAKLVKEHADEFATNPSSLKQALATPYDFVTRGLYNCRHNWELI